MPVRFGMKIGKMKVDKDRDVCATSPTPSLKEVVLGKEQGGLCHFKARCRL